MTIPTAAISGGPLAIRAPRKRAKRLKVDGQPVLASKLLELQDAARRNEVAAYPVVHGGMPDSDQPSYVGDPAKPLQDFAGGKHGAIVSGHLTPCQEVTCDLGVRSPDVRMPSVALRLRGKTMENSPHWPGFAERLADKMKEKNLSPTKLGRLIGAGASTVRSWRLGPHGPKRTRVLDALALALGTTPQWLKFGVSDDDSFVIVVGTVEMGGLIVSEMTGRTRVPAPQGLAGSQLEAYEIQDNSNIPIYNPGDTIFINPNATVPLARLQGVDCLVEVEDGRRFLRRLMPSSVGDLYTLEAHAAQPMIGVRVRRAWQVRSVLRKEIT